MSRIVVDEGGHRFVTSGDTAIVVWRSPPTVASAARMMPFVKELFTERGRPVYIFVVIADGIGLPDDAARAAMAESMSKTAPYTKMILSVIEGEGFRASVIRSISSGMALLARKSAPVKTFATVDEAIHWLAEHDPTTAHPVELRRAVDLALGVHEGP
ncbi:MAG: hypothetical protein U0441_09200 [Polyangiaceae bacterium]